jgi:hypothetical protein
MQVCDQPHPVVVRAILEACLSQELQKALDLSGRLWSDGAVLRVSPQQLSCPLPPSHSGVRLSVLLTVLYGAASLQAMLL